MRHLILGADGNLGHALASELSVQGIPFVGMAFEEVDKLRESHFSTQENRSAYQYIWLCTGGRHREARLDEKRSFRHNVDLPRWLMDWIPQPTRLCFFSTADAAHPEYPDMPHRRAPEAASEFARQKLLLESEVIGRKRPFTSAVRLASVYGTKKPRACLPGILLSTTWPNEYLNFPSNEVTPTPAAWIADCLIQASTGNDLFSPLGPRIHHLAPAGSIGVHDWAKMIFGHLRGSEGFLDRRHWDATRPRLQALGSSLPLRMDHWSHLWEKHFVLQDYQGL